jgi:hypothetical protein
MLDLVYREFKPWAAIVADLTCGTRPHDHWLLVLADIQYVHRA